MAFMDFIRKSLLFCLGLDVLSSKSRPLWCIRCQWREENSHLIIVKILAWITHSFLIVWTPPLCHCCGSRAMCVRNDAWRIDNNHTKTFAWIHKLVKVSKVPQFLVHHALMILSIPSYIRKLIFNEIWKTYVNTCILEKKGCEQGIHILRTKKYHVCVCVWCSGFSHRQVAAAMVLTL